MSDIIIKDLPSEQEVSLQGANNAAIAQAQAISIKNEIEYSHAADFIKTVKVGIKAIETTFSDMKSQANKAHKAICDKENSFKKPLQEAESIVKGKMQIYYAEQERIRREEEARIREEQRRLAEEELKRAAELEAAGKQEQAQVALHTATQIEKLNTVIDMPKPKAEGVSAQDDYEIHIIDEAKVPPYIMGAQIRAIDTAAIKRLAKATMGKIDIPGVMIVSIKSIRIRA